MRLIDADALIEYCNNLKGKTVSANDIARFPTALMVKEVRPEGRPHSRGVAYHCGVCGAEIAVVRDTVSMYAPQVDARYCRICGTKVKWELKDGATVNSPASSETRPMLSE